MASSPPIWIIESLLFFFGAIAVALTGCLISRSRRLRRQNLALRQEREVIFDFVHNVGEVFADAEEVNIDSLLNRILFFATKTGKAAAGAIYLFNTDRTQLFARAVSGQAHRRVLPERP